MRRTVFFVFAALAAFVSAQPVKLDQTVQVPPSGRGTSYAASIDTRSFFPQISTSVSQKAIKPWNPKAKITSVMGPPSFGTSTVTDLPAPNAGPRFPGITATGWSPPDPDVAVGPSHIVQVVNSSLAFFTKAGAVTFQQTAATFFNPVRQTNFQFDPKVMYDRIAQRFVVVYLDLNTGAGISNVLFAISDDSDPNGPWFLYRFDVSEVIGGIDSWLDYPGFGYNKDGYVVCGNMFGFGGGQPFTSSKFVVIPKTPVLTGAAAATTSFTDPVLAPQAAETVDASKDTVFAAARNLNFTNVTRFYALRNLGGVPTLNVVDRVVTPAMPGNLNATSTSGQILDALEGRILTAIWRNNRLYLSYPFDQGGGMVGTRWAEYDTGNWPTSGTVTELQAGNYTSATLHQFMPAIDVNKHGDVSILFTQSSAAVTANLAVAGRITSDAANTMGAATVLVNSVGNNYNQFRWGDYFGVDVDPVDDETFWGTAMVVRADNNWTTHIVSWTVSKTTLLAPATHSLFRGGAVSGNTASLGANDDNYLVARAGVILVPTEAPVQVIMEATGPTGQVLNIDALLVSKVNTPGLSQKIELWDWTNNVWVQVGTTQLSGNASETMQTGGATGTLSRFLQPGTRLMRAKASYFRTGITLIFPWAVSIDQFQWSVRAR